MKAPKDDAERLRTFQRGSLVTTIDPKGHTWTVHESEPSGVVVLGRLPGIGEPRKGDMTFFRFDQLA